MCAEVQLLFLNSDLHWNSVNDILLGPVLDADESKTQTYILAFNHSLCVGTFVHNVDLCYHSNGPDTFWINFTRHLQTIGSCHICVSWQGT